MNKYNRSQIDELLQPLMTMMQEEFPNNCKLIVEPYFARIVYEHDDMIFQSDEMKKPFRETKFANQADSFLQAVLGAAMESAKQLMTEDQNDDH